MKTFNFVLHVLKLNTEISKLFLPVRGVCAEKFAIFITIQYNCCVIVLYCGL